MIVFDIEANGLDDADEIHCLSVNENGKIKSTSNYSNMRSFFSREDLVLIGHNIIRYDIPTLERILDIKIKAKLIDTLALSWYLEPKLDIHGLESWGERFGVPKPPISNWKNLPVKEYIHRCEEDVKINTRLWERQWRQLNKLYGSEEGVWKLIDYLMFKMDCALEQEKSRWKADIPKIESLLDKLRPELQEKVDRLAQVMPHVPTYKVAKKPSRMYLKGKYNTLTVAGEKWFQILKENNLPETHEEDVRYISGYTDPNPNSHTQIKDWLYSLGWEPQSFDFKRNKETNDVRKIPQIKNKITDDGGLCPSVIELFDKEPELENLNMKSIISHRIGILEGFLRDADKEGYLRAKIAGFTNTLRFKHAVVVNLPGVDKPYGSDIRSCLVCDEGYELAGTDLCGLEDRTKQHYMWPYDPEYVKEMMEPGYDPHTNLAVFAGAMTKEQENAYKSGDKSLKSIRHTYKQANYACVYGARPPTVARSAKCDIDTATRLVDTYWERNWSVNKIAESCVVKQVGDQKWLLNPVSNLWYSLRYEKDRFSTLNQGTGVYCFDTWIKHIRNVRPQLTAQFHDEIIQQIKIGHRKQCEKLLRDAMDKTNEELNLNVKLDIDINFGDSYASIH